MGPPRHLPSLLWGLETCFFFIPLTPGLFRRPSSFVVLCGRDCSGPRPPIHMSLQPWPSTVDFFMYPSHPISVSGQ
eukprot:scaffold22969_cov89-Cyclotella_meneghiniana.AAC.10